MHTIHTSLATDMGVTPLGQAGMAVLQISLKSVSMFGASDRE